jgi:hypothetical protein
MNINKSKLSFIVYHKDNWNGEVIKKESVLTSTGELHSCGDNPAVIKLDGTQLWYKNGKYHRDGDKPATIGFDGRKTWSINGQFHRDSDKPSIIESNGTRKWVNAMGALHRDGDKPAEIESDGTLKWYKYGCLYRDDDKPNVIRLDGTHLWFKDGSLHRDNDKPALINSDGSSEFYKNGVRYNVERTQCAIKQQEKDSNEPIEKEFLMKDIQLTLQKLNMEIVNINHKLESNRIITIDN